MSVKALLYECIMKKQKVTIKIPKPLYDSLRKIIDESGFNSVTDFIVYVLRDLASSKSVGKESLTQEEIEMIKKKLKSLNYL